MSDLNERLPKMLRKVAKTESDEGEYGITGHIDWMAADEIERLTALVKTGEDVVLDFMPNIGQCALQDYGRLNHFLMDADKLRKENENETG